MEYRFTIMPEQTVIPNTQKQCVRKTVDFKYNFSLNEAGNPQNKKTVWEMTKDKYKMFLHKGVGHEFQDYEVIPTGELEQVLLREVNLKAKVNTFPMSVAVQMDDGANGREDYDARNIKTVKSETYDANSGMQSLFEMKSTPGIEGLSVPIYKINDRLAERADIQQEKLSREFLDTCTVGEKDNGKTTVKMNTELHDLLMEMAMEIPDFNWQAVKQHEDQQHSDWDTNVVRGVKEMIADSQEAYNLPYMNFRYLRVQIVPANGTAWDNIDIGTNCSAANGLKGPELLNTHFNAEFSLEFVYDIKNVVVSDEDSA